MMWHPGPREATPTTERPSVMPAELPARPSPHAVTAASRWTVTAVVAALVVWAGGLTLHVLGALAPAVAVLGVIAAIVALGREGPGHWRLLATVSGGASLVAVCLYILVLTSTIDWPPFR